jgi:hypothetical protein
MPEYTDPVKKRGFLALDIDGTTLVQRIDHFAHHGLNDSASHVRQSIIEYVRRAQQNGYEILILTARPELIDKGLEALEGKIGTKSTLNIINILNAYDIHIDASHIRRAPAGLKGGKMAEILSEYEHDNPQAVGLLLDDQMKQVSSVETINNPKLFAYDINSPGDIRKFFTQINADINNPFHPDQMINSMRDVTLSKLKVSLKKLHTKEEKYSQEITVIQNLTEELAQRLYEAKYRNYKPEIEWVNKTADGIRRLTDKLNSDESDITAADIKDISQLISGTSNPSKMQPNSRCEFLIQDLLYRAELIPKINQMKQDCMSYYAHLQMVKQQSKEAEPLLQTKMNIMDDLINELNEKKLPNMERIENFLRHLNENKETLEQVRTGRDASWYSSIQKVLAKIPFIGKLFMSEGSKLASKVEASCNLKQFIKAKEVLNEIKSESVLVDSSSKDSSLS